MPWGPSRAQPPLTRGLSADPGRAAARGHGHRSWGSGQEGPGWGGGQGSSVDPTWGGYTGGTWGPLSMPALPTPHPHTCYPPGPSQMVTLPQLSCGSQALKAGPFPGHHVCGCSASSHLPPLSSQLHSGVLLSAPPNFQMDGWMRTSRVRSQRAAEPAPGPPLCF